MDQSLMITTNIKQGDLFCFLLYHFYASFMGVAGVLFSLVTLATLAVTWGTVDDVYTLILLICGLLFTVWNPFLLFLRARKQAKKPVYKKPLTYTFTNTGLGVSQESEKVEFTWEQIRKAVNIRRILVIYTDRIHAHVIPMRLMDGQVEELMGILRESLPKSKCKNLK